MVEKSDNDSKNDARHICFLEAKRKILEKAGTYIESNTKVINNMLDKDEISSFAAALLKVDTVDEEWKFIGESMAIIIVVKAIVDTNLIEKQLNLIRKDIPAQKLIKKQQDQLRALEYKVLKLQKEMVKKDQADISVLRKERNLVFKQIDEIENKKIKIITMIKSKTKNVLQYIECGMTPNEVKALVGNPRSNDDRYDILMWNYGNVWIIFESGVASCIIKSDCFESHRYCSSYKRDKHCIAK